MPDTPLSDPAQLGQNPTSMVGRTPADPPPTAAALPTTPQSLAASFATMTPSQLQKALGGLTVGQEDNPSGGIASSFAKALGSIPASQAAGIMKALSGTGTFGTDVEGDVAGTGGNSTSGQSDLAASTLNSYLTSAQPFLANMQQQGQQATAQYGKEMQSALAGASPQMQAAYAVSTPAMQQAMSSEDTAATQSAENMPNFEALISGLTTEAQNAKAQQYADIEEPYIAATQGGAASGTTPAFGSVASGMAPYYQAMLQQALAGGTTPANALTPASTTANTGVTNPLLSQYTNPATYASPS